MFGLTHYTHNHVSDGLFGSNAGGISVGRFASTHDNALNVHSERTQTHKLQVHETMSVVRGVSSLMYESSFGCVCFERANAAKAKATTLPGYCASGPTVYVKYFTKSTLLGCTLERGSRRRGRRRQSHVIMRAHIHIVRMVRSVRFICTGVLHCTRAPLAQHNSPRTDWCTCVAVPSTTLYYMCAQYSI